jgi:FkbM family methyltransferase
MIYEDDRIKTYDTKYGKISLLANEQIFDPSDPDFSAMEIDFGGRYLDPDKNVLEIGGHCGTSSLVYASFLNEGQKIHVYEPQKSMFLLLVRNIVQNDLTDKIIPYNKGAFCYNGVGYMNDNTLDGFVGTVSKRLNEERDQPCNFGGLSLGIGGEKVELVTIDSMNIENLGYIHCDAQGSENFIFSQAKETITKYRPVIVYENKDRYGDYLFDMVCKTYPDYLEYKDFSLKDFCMNELNYSEWHDGYDILLIP